jgi:hypothetical protein
MGAPLIPEETTADQIVEAAPAEEAPGPEPVAEEIGEDLDRDGVESPGGDTSEVVEEEPMLKGAPPAD